MRNIWKNLIFYLDGLLSIFMVIYAPCKLLCRICTSSFNFMREIRCLFLEKDAYLKQVAFVLSFDQTCASTLKKHFEKEVYIYGEFA